MRGFVSAVKAELTEEWEVVVVVLEKAFWVVDFTKETSFWRIRDGRKGRCWPWVLDWDLFVNGRSAGERKEMYRCSGMRRARVGMTYIQWIWKRYFVPLVKRGGSLMIET